MAGAHSIRKNFRFTDREAALLEKHAAAAELSESEYVRALVRDPERVFTAETESLRSVYRELKKQGTNLNQMAYLANSRKQDGVDIAKFERWAHANAEALALVGRCIDEIDAGRRR